MKAFLSKAEGGRFGITVWGTASECINLMRKAEVRRMTPAHLQFTSDVRSVMTKYCVKVPRIILTSET